LSSCGGCSFLLGEIAVTLGHFRELTRNAEHEMAEAVLACTRARRQMLTALPTSDPVVLH
jgi:hypothetical protein